MDRWIGPPSSGLAVRLKTQSNYRWQSVGFVVSIVGFTWVVIFYFFGKFRSRFTAARDID